MVMQILQNQQGNQLIVRGRPPSLMEYNVKYTNHIASKEYECEHSDQKGAWNPQDGCHIKGRPYHQQILKEGSHWPLSITAVSIYHGP